jgi:hypothetical protein
LPEQLYPVWNQHTHLLPERSHYFHLPSKSGQHP